MVPGRGDVFISEIELIAADAGERSCRGADLGRVIRDGADGAAGEGSQIGELAADQLHAVAGIARKSHGDSRTSSS